MAVLFFYLGLFVLLTAEEAGIFLLPGDISLVAAGVQSSVNHSPFFLLIAWGCASAGMVAGASGLFHTLNKSKRTSHLLPRRARALVRRNPVWGVAAARMVPGLRNATVFAAASAGLKYKTFVMGLIPAALTWSGMLLVLGWYGGGAIVTTIGILDGVPGLKFGSLALFASILSFAGYRIWVTRHRHLPPEVVSESHSREG